MKKINFKINYILLLAVIVCVFYSCKKDPVYEQTRLFRPVLNKPLTPLNNTITVNLGKMKSAVSYKVELSRDSFKTAPIKTVTDTATIITFKNLLWNTAYQVRATAFAADTFF